MRWDIWTVLSVLFLCDGNQIICFAETQQYIIILFSREKAMYCKYVCYFEQKDEDNQSDFSQRSKCWAGMDLNHLLSQPSTLNHLFIYFSLNQSVAVENKFKTGLDNLSAAFQLICFWATQGFCRLIKRPGKERNFKSLKMCRLLLCF